MKKKTLLIGGFAVAAIAAIYIYKKSKKQQLTLTVPTASVNPGGYDGSGINPGGVYNKPVITNPDILVQKPVIRNPVIVTRPGTSLPITRTTLVEGLGCYSMS